MYFGHSGHHRHVGCVITFCLPLLTTNFIKYSISANISPLKIIFLCTVDTPDISGVSSNSGSPPLATKSLSFHQTKNAHQKVIFLYTVCPWSISASLYLHVLLTPWTCPVYRQPQKSIFLCPVATTVMSGVLSLVFTTSPLIHCLKIYHQT